MIHLEHALYSSEICTLEKLEQKYFESFEIRRWKRMEKINWSDKVNDEEILERREEDAL